jgi:hypothetical protein
MSDICGYVRTDAVTLNKINESMKEILLRETATCNRNWQEFILSDTLISVPAQQPNTRADTVEGSNVWYTDTRTSCATSGRKTSDFYPHSDP